MSLRTLSPVAMAMLAGSAVFASHACAAPMIHVPSAIVAGVAPLVTDKAYYCRYGRCYHRYYGYRAYPRYYGYGYGYRHYYGPGLSFRLF